MIAPMMRWDHSVDWPVVNILEHGAAGGGGIAAVVSYTIDPFSSDSKDTFYLDHVVDGRTLFPFTGHIVLAWKALARIKSLDVSKAPIVLHDMMVHRGTILTKSVKFHVVFSPGTGHFEIMEGDSLAASGKMCLVEEPTAWYYENVDRSEKDRMLCDRVTLTTEDVYKEFLLRGYEYGMFSHQKLSFQLKNYRTRISWHLQSAQQRCARHDSMD